MPRWMTCEHGFDRPHYTLPVNARDCDGTPNAVLAYAATLPGAEQHRVSIGDDGELRVDPALLLDEGESYLVIHLRDR